MGHNCGHWDPASFSAAFAADFGARWVGCGSKLSGWRGNPQFWSMLPRKPGQPISEFRFFEPQPDVGSKASGAGKKPRHQIRWLSFALAASPSRGRSRVMLLTSILPFLPKCRVLSSPPGFTVSPSSPNIPEAETCLRRNAMRPVQGRVRGLASDRDRVLFFPWSLVGIKFSQHVLFSFPGSNWTTTSSRRSRNLQFLGGTSHWVGDLRFQSTFPFTRAPCWIPIFHQHPF